MRCSRRTEEGDNSISGLAEFVRIDSRIKGDILERLEAERSLSVSC